MQPKILLLANKTSDYYKNAIEACGAVGVVKYLPDLDVDYDGLILCGGNDIQPHYYGQEINGAIDFDVERDKTEFALLEKFIETGKPIMGICRGHQLLNVAFGGTLIQHIDNVEIHRFPDLNFPAEHLITAKENSLLHRIYGEKFVVNSIHHQAVDKAGNGFKVTALSEDGLIEAIEHEIKPYFSVQFHPERMSLSLKTPTEVDGIEIFKHFIDLCKKHI